jgi:hypothetical protein
VACSAAAQQNLQNGYSRQYSLMVFNILGVQWHLLSLVATALFWPVVHWRVRGSPCCTTRFRPDRVQPMTGGGAPAFTTGQRAQPLVTDPNCCWPAGNGPDRDFVYVGCFGGSCQCPRLACTRPCASTNVILRIVRENGEFVVTEAPPRAQLPASRWGPGAAGRAGDGDGVAAAAVDAAGGEVSHGVLPRLFIG